MKLVSCLIVILFTSTTFAQNLTYDSYTKAREVLDRSVAAYGGVEKLRSIENFSLKAVGDTVQRNQSRKPFASDRTPYRIDIVIDLKGNRMSQLVQGGYPGGFSYNNGFAVEGTNGITYDFVRKTASPRPNIQPAVVRQRMRYVPQTLVINALDRASRLRSLGRTDFLGRAHNAVSYANEDGAEIALYFDSTTNLLSKFEVLGTDPFMGDVVTEFAFSGYKTEDGIPIAQGRTVKVGGELNEDLRYEQLSFNTTLDAAMFKPPAGMTEAKPAPQNADPVTKLSENVYVVLAGGYNVMFVGFKDYVFVMETPGSDAVSNRAIEAIKKTIPGKPIKYVSVTHHHDDHAGGLRRYIAEGATLIAAPGERAFFEKITKSRFTIEPDELTRKPQPLKIETISSGKRVLTDGVMTVEIIDIGNGPHTEEMLVAYLPNEKIIFQGDLINRPANGDYPIANDTSVHFLRWIDSKKLAVERIIPVHGTVTTMDEFRRAVADMEANTKSGNSGIVR
jgi:glyoxylase-like metal-dependent hydrolase (beta-lactamase superfamily II)